MTQREIDLVQEALDLIESIPGDQVALDDPESADSKAARAAQLLGFALAAEGRQTVLGGDVTP